MKLGMQRCSNGHLYPAGMSCAACDRASEFLLREACERRLVKQSEDVDDIAGRLAAANAEIERLTAELHETRLTAENEAKVRDEHFTEITQLRTALRETREALRDVSGLAAKAANCELAAAASLEPDTDVFGSSGIADKALTARSKAAWKELDDRIDAVLARHAPLAEEAVK